MITSNSDKIEFCTSEPRSCGRFRFGKATLIHADCFDWLPQQHDNSIHAVVTDPPYGLHEYSPEQQAKLRKGRGGVWRIPPSFDGHVRSPLPRFTTLTPEQLERTRSLMNANVLDSLVTGYTHLIEGLTLPDPGDRHVLAAAIRCGRGRNGCSRLPCHASGRSLMRTVISFTSG